MVITGRQNVEIPVDRDQPFHSAEADRKTGKANEGLPPAPWIRGGERNRNGVQRHPGARFFDGPGGGKKHKGKKFVHPANANRSHHKRTNFQGRRQPDFGQK